MTKLWKQFHYCAAVCFGLLLFPGGQAAAATAQAIVMSAPQIQQVGGKSPPLGTSKWQAALIKRNYEYIDGLFCGASFISSKWALTAAHCFFEKDSCVEIYKHQIVLGYGSDNLGRAISLRAIANIVRHPDYKCMQQHDDIALVELTDDATGIQSIDLPDAAQAAALSAGQQVNGSGWGYTMEHGYKSRDLQEILVPIVSTGDCKAHYGALPAKAICAGRTGVDACTGDSGGPLYIRNGARMTQYGVVSYGEGCARQDRPGIYSDVWQYAQWIKDETASKPCTKKDIEEHRC